ncbi:endonuclease VII domain-containing protein [Streptomyces sp. NPDC050534]|uniref:endonuclease VII domain-containing protein n=1 Tax=Streptomyces sp. NPDC050534 TaxID=3365625 RepID=UPI0037BC0004
MSIQKTCTRCKEVRPEGAFHKKGDGRRRTVCGVCRNAARQGKRQETPEQRLKRKLWDLYKLTLDDYAALLDAQAGVCAICHKGPTAKRRLAVDHCHDTGVVRALLCNYCNVIVGVYENHRQAAADYLAVYGAGNPILNP